MAIDRPNYTQVYNQFLDEYMRIVSSSATKVFLAITRLTSGWQKDWDKISNSQIAEYTGLSNHTVIEAIRELVELDLIDRYQSGIGKATETFYRLKYKTEEPNSAKSAPINDGNSAENAPIDQSNSAKIAHTKESVNTNKEYKETYANLKRSAKQRGTPTYPSSFEDWYKSYPNPQNKKQTLYNWILCVEGGAKETDLLIAAQRYAEHCKKEGVDKKYIKHSTTFLGPAEPWRDWTRAGLTDMLVEVCTKCGKPRKGTEGFCVACGGEFK